MGGYAFTGLDAGDYVVEFELPTGYDSYSPQDQGVVDAVDSDADPTTGGASVTLVAGETNSRTDAGMFITGKAPIQLGDYVWIDGKRQPDPK